MSHNEILEHYGKKGMKWGITTKSDGSKTRTVKKSAETMSNAELAAKVKRLNMEQQYNTLMKKKSDRNATSLEKGRGEVTRMLGVAGKQNLQPLITTGVAVVGGAIAGVIATQSGRIFTAGIKTIGR